jgi:hypothetical protein
MTRWSYVDQPSWVWEEDCVREPWGWVGVVTRETYVCIRDLPGKADEVVDNIEWETGINILFEDTTLGPDLIMLE